MQLFHYTRYRLLCLLVLQHVVSAEYEGSSNQNDSRGDLNPTVIPLHRHLCVGEVRKQQKSYSTYCCAAASAASKTLFSFSAAFAIEPVFRIMICRFFSCTAARSNYFRSRSFSSLCSVKSSAQLIFGHLFFSFSLESLMIFRKTRHYRAQQSSDFAEIPMIFIFYIKIFYIIFPLLSIDNRYDFLTDNLHYKYIFI